MHRRRGLGGDLLRAFHSRARSTASKPLTSKATGKPESRTTPPCRLGPTSIDWTATRSGGAPRALDLAVDFVEEEAPSIAVVKDGRAFRAPVGLKPLARWLTSAAGEREPLALIPTYAVARLRAVR
ncbi:hypothetical protein [Caulobacter sp.]|uniref:hypothetical protein n=1 Tax=Caulobacter sp. TaxID=78 RepID=UPI0031D04F1E